MYRSIPCAAACMSGFVEAATCEQPSGGAVVLRVGAIGPDVGEYPRFEGAS